MLRRMRDENTKHEFISAEEFDELSEGEFEDKEYDDEEVYSETAEKCKELTGLANSGNGVSRISVPREIKRQRVVNAFHDAFELIGGVPRLAHWADDHPTDFYKLYARMIPVEAAQKGTQADAERRIQHILPPSPLDKES